MNALTGWKSAGAGRTAGFPTGRGGAVEGRAARNGSAPGRGGAVAPASLLAGGAASAQEDASAPNRAKELLSAGYSS